VGLKITFDYAVGVSLSGIPNGGTFPSTPSAKADHPVMMTKRLHLYALLILLVLVAIPFTGKSEIVLPPNIGLNIEPNTTTICQGSTVSVSIENSQLQVNYQFFNGATPSGPIAAGTGGTITLTSAPIIGSITLTVRATETFVGGTSANLTETVTVTVVPPPSSANAGNDQIICGLTTNLNAINPLSGTGQWSQVSGPALATFGNINVRNTNVSVSTSGTYVFRWTVSRNPCTASTDDVSIIFSQPPTVSNAGTDQVVCGLSSSLAANSPSVGSATWFLVSGPGGASFSDNTSPTTTITVFIPGTYVAQWTIFSGVCPLSSDQVTLEFFQTTIPADAGDDQVVCGLTTFLNANNPGSQSGTWTQLSGPDVAVFVDINDPSTQVTVPLEGDYEFIWNINNPPCTPTSDPVLIDFNFTAEICNGLDDDCDFAIDEDFDLDFDGFTSCNGDCDDNNASVYPGAPELCDGLDNDCDADIDEGVQLTFYADTDGDGFGDNATTVLACTPPAGFVTDNTDCDDTNNAIFPGAAEICNNSDDNCDTQIDEGVQITFYADADGDGFGDNAVNTLACVVPVGFVADNTDCDDANNAIFPAAAEICNTVDDDCDTLIDEGVESTYYADADGDGFGDNAVTVLSCAPPAGFVADNTDCDDTNNTIFPGAAEVCNNEDDDCDTDIDEGVQNTFYADADGDGFGDNANSTAACAAPIGFVTDNTDCDDTDNTVFPGAAEVCDGLDNDCDTDIDEGVLLTYYEDLDGDGFGNATISQLACLPPVGYVTDNSDCDDTNNAVFPGAAEVCNAIDDDCDTVIDNGALLTFYQDADGDGFGNIAINTLACTPPVGFVFNDDDCDDANNAISPGAVETCNTIDDDCDTAIDEGVTFSFFADADGDGFGNPSLSIQACSQPVGFVPDNTDCDDTNNAIFPGAAEVCNTLDDNCDTQIDEGVQTTYYADADGDGFGDNSVITLACAAPAGFVSDNTDCDDTNNAIFPGATEVCNNQDDDCDTDIDEGVQNTFYADGDGDGFGDNAVSTAACAAPIGFVTDNTDCDDTDNTVFPGGTEVCDNQDNDCDLDIDEGTLLTFYADADGDGFGDAASPTQACTAPAGFVNNDTDCDDTNNTVFPGAAEVCDNLDNDCDLDIDEGTLLTFYSDADGDGFGNALSSVQACSAPTGFVADDTDCDDTNNAIFPGATELCNTFDDDCDTLIDEGAQTTFFQDADGDGFGNNAVTALACTAPVGFVSTNTDCDDTDNAIFPGAVETCNTVDDDCDTVIDEGVQSTYYADADGDGFGNNALTALACTAPVGFVTDNTDCDDANNTIFPGATETCNNADDDCDTVIDEGVQSSYFQDADGDGFGNNAVTVLACTVPAGFVTDNTDCEDSDNTVFPGAPEVCDNLDNDCDLAIDEGVQLTFYADTDGDGFGNNAVITLACTPPVGFVADNTDCDDSDNTIFPGAPEFCDGIDNDCDTDIDEATVITFYLDADGDGFGDPANSIEDCITPVGYVLNDDDCDDTNNAINPAAAEVCDGDDNDCDTQVDEGVLITYYADADGDGFGNAAVNVQACTVPLGFVLNDDDCDDTNNAINPAAAEVCDGDDNDCDTLVDEGVLITFYADADSDGFGNAAVNVQACTAPVGFIANDDDCDDTNNTIFPGAAETCNNLDDDCDTVIDEGVQFTFYADADGDGFGNNAASAQACSAPVGFVVNNTDCDDTNNTIFPGALEVCNSVDDDCDTQIDEGVQSTFYADTDGDGFGNNVATLQACTAPVGFVANNTDCDDTNNTIFPGATEICDNQDNDCDLSIDEGVLQTFHADADGDGFGDNATTVIACTAPVGFVADNTDCNDTDNTVFPGAIEICDNQDNDCDLAVDEGALLTFYADTDGDGFGNNAASLQACIAPIGFVGDNTDCDDTDNTVFPGAAEVCDNQDNDCDLAIDEGAGTVWFPDADNDGFGDNNLGVVLCVAPTGFIATGGDCDDSNNAINPLATEICDTADNDCDTAIDEGLTITYYADTDGDGFGDNANSTDECTAPIGYVTNNTDCDDSDADIFPGAAEICNNADDDCDTVIDEGVQFTYYQDADGDGFGNPTSTILACSVPAGYVSDSTDCDDTNASVNTDALEICNTIDDDCDGAIDEDGGSTWYLDSDGDGFGDAFVNTVSCTAPTGYVNNDADCDDTNAAIFPGATEICNDEDEDCDEEIDEDAGVVWYQDFDTDGFGNESQTITQCDAPNGYVAAGGDCDDTNAAISPIGTEVCNGVDDDCDATIDDGVGSAWFQDSDGDGFGNPSVDSLACAQPAGYVADNTDCDDANNTIFPGATETCNTLDDDCDTDIDEDGGTTWYQDNDGDQFGDASVALVACTAPAGYVADSTDCDDDNPLVFPGAIEVCNSADDDCDTDIDEDAGTAWFADADGDGFGNESTSIIACTQPEGYTSTGGDCDDTNADISPVGVEICNDLDDDCDSDVDEDAGTLWFEDADEDGFGNAAVSMVLCNAPDGYVDNAADCDDSNASVNPNAEEVCNGIDDDCNDGIDEIGDITFYYDGDGDGYGTPDSTIVGCTAPLGFVDNNTDCADDNDAINPGAVEQCDELDNDCDLDIDEGFPTNACVDTDNDGLVNLDDVDDDNDGITDAAEASTAQSNGDTDGDGAPDGQDLDSDGDGIFDVLEANGSDPDGDGIIGEGNPTDSDSDGLADDAGTGLDAVDSDNDGAPDFQDTDSDNDTVLDNIEYPATDTTSPPQDSDNDGLPDFRDPDDDNDGLSTATEWDYDSNGLGPDDCDVDGVFNYLDTDPCDLFIPEGFSPNGDGKNDTYVIENITGNATISLVVFNRWGGAVYTSSNYQNDWDGRAKSGEDLPSGTYFYKIQFSDGRPQSEGSLTLWR
jgi:gliding motility-associated-like protein